MEVEHHHFNKAVIFIKTLSQSFLFFESLSPKEKSMNHLILHYALWDCSHNR